MGRTLARPANEAATEGNLARGGQAVTEYLATEVLDRLTAEQRRFLLRTSVLDELSAGPCRALAGDRAGVLLRELARTVQLLVPVAADPSVYRHHRGLSALLSDVLGSEGSDTVVSLHRSAAQWYSRRGDNRGRTALDAGRRRVRGRRVGSRRLGEGGLGRPWCAGLAVAGPPAVPHGRRRRETVRRGGDGGALGRRPGNGPALAGCGAAEADGIADGR